MLVLSRKEGEVIKIDRDVTITVTRIEGSRVRIAIDAPSYRRILRGELHDREVTDLALSEQR
jgi:carbon storage regulator CsrA